MEDREALKLALQQAHSLTLELASEKIFVNLAFQLILKSSGMGKDALERLANGELNSEDPNAVLLAGIVRERSKVILASL